MEHKATTYPPVIKTRLAVWAALGAIVGCTMAAGIRAGTSWVGIAGLALLGAGTAAAHVTSPGRRQRAWLWLMGVGWVCACLIPTSMIASLAGNPDVKGYWYAYFALAGWVASATTLPASLPQADYA
ncbi:MAG: hypothetical protein ACLQVX_08525 [Limisphaerales bacterium]